MLYLIYLSDGNMFFFENDIKYNKKELDSTVKNIIDSLRDEEGEIIKNHIFYESFVKLMKQHKFKIIKPKICNCDL